MLRPHRRDRRWSWGRKDSSRFRKAPSGSEFILRWPGSGQAQKAQFGAWSKTAPHIFYRPNLWYWTGGAWGLPDIALKNVSEDFRFLGENHCIGLFVDTAQEHWSTQGPQYYLMAQLTWDRFQDPQAVLNDYYARGFGKSADKIRRYHQLLETAFVAITAAPIFGPNARDRFNLLKILQQVYTDRLFQEATDIMHQAEQLVAGDERTDID